MAILRNDPFQVPVDLQLFGGASILVEGAPPRNPIPKKLFALIARLAVSPLCSCTRTHAANDIWPEVDTESQRLYNLRRTLSTTHRVVGPRHELLLQPSKDYLQLNIEVTAVDVITFDSLSASQDPARIEAAVKLYKGPLLPGFNEAWVVYERLKRQSAYLRSIHVLRNAARAANDSRKLIDLCHLAVGVDPTCESEVRELMSALADSGEVAAASSAYKKFTRALMREHSLEPDLEMMEFHRRISLGKLRKIGLTIEYGAANRARRQAGEFSRPITPILGRSKETQQLCALVRANRLVTITAGGGFGKTRLSLHAADILSREFSGGVWFVDLAPLTNPALVTAAIMERLGVKELPGVSRLQALKNHLEAVPTLVVLDNCEHLRDAAAKAALNLLTSSADLRILATSRQSLGVTGEALLRLGPLASPDLNSKTSVDSISISADSARIPGSWIEQYPALALFLQRAQAHGAFQLTTSAVLAAASICSKLEGNALAIELVAVQTRSSSVEDLDTSLEDLFTTLVSNNPTLLPRQQTLSALIDWSFNLLPEAEAALLSRLSVFRGSWNLAAAAEICCGEGIDRKAAPTLIANLTDKSLVETIASDGSMRFRLLEMVRVYVRYTRLGGSATGDPHYAPFEDRLLAYYMEFALRQKPRLMTNDQPGSLNQLEQERDNLRAALEVSIERGESEFALRMANSMWRYWSIRGYYSEGLAWFDRALALPPAAPLKLLCESYFHAGNIAFNALRLTESRTYFEKCLTLEVERADPVLIASTRASIALILESEGKYEESLETLFDSIEVLQNKDRGFLAAVCRSNIGNNHVGLGNYTAAIEQYRAAISTFRSFSATSDFAHAMVSYGAALALNGDAAAALAVMKETMPVINSLASVNDLARALLVYVCIAVKQNAYEDAASLLGAYASHIGLHRLTPTMLQSQHHDRDLLAVRMALGDQFQPHYDHGCELQSTSLELFIKSRFH